MTTTNRSGLYSIGLMAMIVCAKTAYSSDDQMTVETSTWNDSNYCCCQTSPKTLFRWSNDSFPTADAGDVPDYEEWARSRIFFVSPKSMGTQE